MPIRRWYRRSARPAKKSPGIGEFESGIEPHRAVRIAIASVPHTISARFYPGGEGVPDRDVGDEGLPRRLADLTLHAEGRGEEVERVHPVTDPAREEDDPGGEAELVGRQLLRAYQGQEDRG